MRAHILFEASSGTVPVVAIGAGVYVFQQTSARYTRTIPSEKENTMLKIGSLRRGAAAAVAALIMGFTVSAAAGDILDDWDSVKLPAKPELKTVTLDPSTTALLILDMQ